MAVHVESGFVTIDRAYCAGFLMCQESGQKEYAAFSMHPGEQPTFVRSCSPQEKKVLAKLVYAKRIVRSVSATMHDGGACLLFAIR